MTEIVAGTGTIRPSGSLRLASSCTSNESVRIADAAAIVCELNLLKNFIRDQGLAANQGQIQVDTEVRVKGNNLETALQVPATTGYRGQEAVQS